MADKIYIGSGKQVQNYDIVNCSICLSDIPKDMIFEYQGKKYLKISVAKKREVDKFGKTHSISIDEYKPKIEQVKYQKQDLEPQTDDLPF